jgi:hypothetical protein
MEAVIEKLERKHKRQFLAGEPYQRRVAEQLGASPRRSIPQAGLAGSLPVRRGGGPIAVRDP